MPLIDYFHLYGNFICLFLALVGKTTHNIDDELDQYEAQDVSG